MSWPDFAKTRPIENGLQVEGCVFGPMVCEDDLVEVVCVGPLVVNGLAERMDWAEEMFSRNLS